MVLKYSFYRRDVLEVAPDLLGKILVRKISEKKILRYRILETEAYRGEEDKGCHCSKGRTARNDIMYHPGGLVYVYLIYGMYWMLNIVTGEKENPQAVLIRGIEEYSGPGKLTKALQIDKSFYGEDLCKSSRIWVEDDGVSVDYYTTPRIGIDYAGEYWKNKLWRFVVKT